MILSELLRGEPVSKLSGSQDAQVAGLRHDSREILAGELFFALPGTRTDGALHAREALAKGASVIVSEAAAPHELPEGRSWVQVPSAPQAMARMADLFFGRPSRSLTAVGVTGTNGKTTTTYYLEAAAKACGKTSGVVGTIEYRLDGRRLSKAPNTTPVSLELSRLLARFRDGGASCAFMEVSSHALALGRVEAVDFDAAVFLNLSRDHLDFHRTTDAYFESKARLFDLLARPDNVKPNKVAALNADDPRGPGLAARAPGCRAVLFGLGEAARDLRARVAESTLDGSRFHVDWGGRRFEASTKLPGAHNVSNALGAAAALLGLGYPADRVLEGLACLEAVPGRLEPVREGQDFHVFVDYAHTDSALRAVLSLLRSLSPRRLITVVGCGGDRDRGKRGPMGLAACQGGDFAVFTSDNPRSEDPQAILRDIEQGVRAAGCRNYKMLPDRGEAIASAIAQARTGDVVLIAGKGHETEQILRDRVLAFDDRRAARDALRTLK